MKSLPQGWPIAARAFTPQELLQRAAGSSMDPAPYLRYLERKLGDLLGAAVA